MNSSFIGIGIAVTGNILISIALNLQKYAHLQRQREQTTLLEEGQEDFSYLKSTMWWIGVSIMAVGEAGNFIAYGFAPASVIAPLGTFALISNSIIAPIALGERLRIKDIAGILLTILGVCAVVATSKTEEKTFPVEDILLAITSTKFVIYAAVTIGLMLFLFQLSRTPLARKTALVDLTLVALFGGFTVLATKAISSLLNMTFLVMFSYWISYVLFFVLVSTAVLQLRFLNKALQNFDSTVVIPIQFVLFTISAILGSAVLYDDFSETDILKTFIFLFGCLLTFAGVYLITHHRPMLKKRDNYLATLTVDAVEQIRPSRSMPAHRLPRIDSRYSFSARPVSFDPGFYSASAPDRHGLPYSKRLSLLGVELLHAVGSRHPAQLALNSVLETYQVEEEEERLFREADEVYPL